jgi:hypothetical protein
MKDLARWLFKLPNLSQEGVCLFLSSCTVVWFGARGIIRISAASRHMREHRDRAAGDLAAQRRRLTNASG